MVSRASRVRVETDRVELRIIDDEVFRKLAVSDQPAALIGNLIRCREAARKTCNVTVGKEAAPVRVATEIGRGIGDVPDSGREHLVENGRVTACTHLVELVSRPLRESWPGSTQ
jgi:hypothetical protein